MAERLRSYYSFEDIAKFHSISFSVRTYFFRLFGGISSVTPHSRLVGGT